MVLGEVIPNASDLPRRIQAPVANLATERDGRRPGPAFRSLMVGRDVDWMKGLVSDLSFHLELNRRARQTAVIRERRKDVRGKKAPHRIGW